jgi:hypothetical protein
MVGQQTSMAAKATFAGLFLSQLISFTTALDNGVGKLPGINQYV